MAIKRHITALGTPPKLASAIVGAADAGGLTALGTNLATAYAIGGGFAGFTTVASGTGAALPLADPGDDVFVSNLSASQALLVYPDSALNTIQGGSAGAGFSVAANKSAVFKKVTATAWGAILSA